MVYASLIRVFGEIGESILSCSDRSDLVNVIDGYFASIHLRDRLPEFI